MWFVNRDLKIGMFISIGRTPSTNDELPFSVFTIRSSQIVAKHFVGATAVE